MQLQTYVNYTSVGRIKFFSFRESSLIIAEALQAIYKVFAIF
jgi:hypothetical protein